MSGGEDGSEGHGQSEGVRPGDRSRDWSLAIHGRAAMRYLREKPGVRWFDVVGLYEAKRAIEEAVVFPSVRPDLYPYGFARGILLFGPPGCGKTLLASAAATEIEATFYNVAYPDLATMWFGEMERGIQTLFEQARDACRANDTPSIIFIDEFDAVSSVEERSWRQTRPTFLAEMDRLEDKRHPLPVYVLGATNKPWVLDSAFVRRFEKRIHVPPPDREGRIQMFALLAKKAKVAAVDWERLADATADFTGSDIRDLFADAHQIAVRELFIANRAESGAPVRRLAQADFSAALARRPTSLSSEDVRRCEEWAQQFATEYSSGERAETPARPGAGKARGEEAGEKLRRLLEGSPGEGGVNGENFAGKGRGR